MNREAALKGIGIGEDDRTKLISEIGNYCHVKYRLFSFRKLLTPEEILEDREVQAFLSRLPTLKKIIGD
jgi:hypothetical protein